MLETRLADHPKPTEAEKRGLFEVLVCVGGGFFIASLAGYIIFGITASTLAPLSWAAFFFIDMARGFIFFCWLAVVALANRKNIPMWFGTALFALIVAIALQIQHSNKHKAGLSLALDRSIVNPVGKIPLLFMADGPWAAKGAGEILANGQASRVALLQRQDVRTPQGGALVEHKWVRTDYELVEARKCELSFDANRGFASGNLDYANTTLASFGVFDRCIARTKVTVAQNYKYLLEPGILFRKVLDDRVFPEKVFSNPKIGAFDGYAAYVVKHHSVGREIARWEYARTYNPSKTYGTPLSRHSFMEALTRLDNESSGMLIRRTPRAACEYITATVLKVPVRPDGASQYLYMMTTTSSMELNVNGKPYLARRFLQDLIDGPTIASCEKTQRAVCSQRFIDSDIALQKCNELFDVRLAYWRKLVSQ